MQQQKRNKIEQKQVATINFLAGSNITSKPKSTFLYFFYLFHAMETELSSTPAEIASLCASVLRASQVSVITQEKRET